MSHWIGGSQIDNHLHSSIIILQPLHSKLGLMKRCTKFLNKIGDCFKLIREKVNEVEFLGPQTRQLTNSTFFHSFLKVISIFLGNTGDPDYQSIVERMLTCFQELGCHMSLKVHFYIHL